MAKRIAGTCYIKVDGTQLEIKGGLEIPIAEVSRETIMGASGPAGFKETAIVPSVKFTGIFTADFPIAKLVSGTDMTITSELANGKVHTLSGAYLVGEATAKVEDGEIDLEFNGSKGIWK